MRYNMNEQWYQTVWKFLNRHAREKQITAGVRGVNLVGGKVEELCRKGFVEKMSFEPGVEERSTGWW